MERFTLLVSDDYFYRIKGNDIRESFLNAALNNDLETLIKIWQSLEDNEQVRLWVLKKSEFLLDEWRQFPVFCEVAKKGHLEVLTQLWEWAGILGYQKNMLSANGFHVVNEAGEGGCREIMQQLLNWICDLDCQKEMLQTSFFSGLKATAKIGSLSLVKQIWNWINLYGYQETVFFNPFIPVYFNAICAALDEGHLPIAEFLLEQADSPGRQAAIFKKQKMILINFSDFNGPSAVNWMLNKAKISQPEKLVSAWCQQIFKEGVLEVVDTHNRNRFIYLSIVLAQRPKLKQQRYYLQKIRTYDPQQNHSLNLLALSKDDLKEWNEFKMRVGQQTGNYKHVKPGSVLARAIALIRKPNGYNLLRKASFLAVCAQINKGERV